MLVTVWTRARRTISGYMVAPIFTLEKLLPDFGAIFTGGVFCWLVFRIKSAPLCPKGLTRVRKFVGLGAGFPAPSRFPPGDIRCPALSFVSRSPDNLDPSGYGGF